MKEIDIEIVTSAEEDYTEVYSLVSYISKKLGINYSDAVVEFFSRCSALRNAVPIEMFYSDEIYGEMHSVPWHELVTSEIVNDLDELAGAPYYYIYVNSSEDFGYYVHSISASRA